MFSRHSHANWRKKPKNIRKFSQPFPRSSGPICSAFPPSFPIHSLSLQPCKVYCSFPNLNSTLWPLKNVTAFSPPCISEILRNNIKARCLLLGSLSTDSSFYSFRNSSFFPSVVTASQAIAEEPSISSLLTAMGHSQPALVTARMGYWAVWDLNIQTEIVLSVFSYSLPLLLTFSFSSLFLSTLLSFLFFFFMDHL